jgi:hypothetical protein
MTRSLAALACFASLLGTPARSDASPWMYEDSFFRPYWGSGYAWGGSSIGYTAGYAPFYSGYVASYAPWAAGDACCAPCAPSCCNPCGNACGTSCDPGCGNCPGGNCATGTSNVPSTPADSGSGANPTYAPPTSNPQSRTPPQDQFEPARNTPAPRNRDASGAGTTPSTGGFNPPATGGAIADPNTGGSAPDFAPAQPQPGYFDRRDDQSRENGATTPKLNPIEPGDKVAFKTPVRITRSTIQPVFELPTIVSAPPVARPEAAPAPTAVASK